MLPDKMTIDHSNHLFVHVAFVFCLLSPVIHASDSLDDYTDSRQLEKNPAVSRHNIQRLPNYNWKPPDKYYGPRKESTERNPGMEFTKPEDSEQRTVNPWIKKMQEISRQEREKWAAYRRNVKLTLDNVEETTKAGKLTDVESITLDPATLKPLVQHLSTDQDNTDMKGDTSDNRFWTNSKQYADINVASNEKLKSDEWSTDIKNSSEKLLQKAPITATHQRHKDYEISDVTEDPFQRNADTDYEITKFKKDHLNFTINSHPEKSISHEQFIDALHVLKSMHKNFTKSSENDENLNNTNGSKEISMKKYSKPFNFSRKNKRKKSSNNNKENEEKTMNSSIRRSNKNDNVNSRTEELILEQSTTPHVPEKSLNENLEEFSETSENLNYKTDSKFPMEKYLTQTSQDDNEESNEDNKDEKTAKSLIRKRKKHKHNAGRKDMTEKLNHEGSFRSGRWGMSVSSPPVEFLKDMSRRSMHRKNEEQIEKDGKHSFGRWGMSVVSPARDFFEDISMHQGHPGIERFTAKAGSRPNEVKGSFDNRPPIHQSRHRNLQATPIQQLITDEHYKKLLGTLLGKVPNGFYDSRYSDPSYWNNYSTNTDLNNSLFLRFLQALRSYIWQNDMNISMSCRMRIPCASSRI